MCRVIVNVRLMIIDPPGKKRANVTPLQTRFGGGGRGRALAREPIGRRRRRRRIGMGRPLIVLSLLAAMGVWLGEREAPDARVVAGIAYVVDGDTLRIGDADIRLVGFDAPEMRQFCRREGIDRRCGVEARSEMERLVADAETRCVLEGSDRWGRDLARCEARGRDLGAAMVLAGHAVADGDYLAEEREARLAGRGVWAGEFEHPRAWRAAQGPSEAGFD